MAFGSVVARRFGAVIAGLGLAALTLIAVPTSAQAAATGTAWTGSGPGTTTVVSDGTVVPPRFSYQVGTSSLSTWTFSTTATADGTVELPYDYFGFHAYFHVTAFLNAFVTHGGTTTPTSLVAAGPSNCCSAPSAGFNYTGDFTFTVQTGDTYGFTMGGSNSDSNHDLQGTLDLGTPQTITFPTPADTPIGHADVALSASSSSTLTVALTSTTPSVCTIVNGAAHLLTLGTCSVAASQAGNLTYDPATVTDSFAVTQAVPTVTAHASATTAAGGHITDAVTLTGGMAPTGTVRFDLYGPTDPTCAATPLFTTTKTVIGDGHYASAAYAPTATGTYHWIASYSGDANNIAVAGICGAATQAIVVTAAAAASVTVPPVQPLGSDPLAATGATYASQLTILAVILLVVGAATLLLGRRELLARVICRHRR